MKDEPEKPSHLTVIEGARTKRRAGRRTSLDEPEQATCYQCMSDIGVETSAVVEMTLAPRRKPNGKLIGGTKSFVCVYCLTRGKITKMVD